MACSAFSREAFGRLGIPRRAQEKLEGVPKGLDGSVEIGPGFFDSDGGFIDAPGVIAGFEVRSAAFVQLWGILLAESYRSWYGPPAGPVRASSLPDRGN